MSGRDQYYEIYRQSRHDTFLLGLALANRCSIGNTLTDTLDEFITQRKIEPQLAMKILQHFDRCIAEVLKDKVKTRLSFKGHLDTYRFCDEVWTFLIKDVNLKLDNQSTIHSDRIKIVSCSAKRPDKEEETPEPWDANGGRINPPSQGYSAGYRMGVTSAVTHRRPESRDRVGSMVAEAFREHTKIVLAYDAQYEIDFEKGYRWGRTQAEIDLWEDGMLGPIVRARIGPLLSARLGAQIEADQIKSESE